MKPSHALKNDLIDRTLEVWQPRLGRDLTREDARQIAENIVGFVEILNEWRIEEATASMGRQPNMISTRAESAPITGSMSGTAQEVTTEHANS